MITSPKIHEIQNDSKRIVEEEKFEYLPLQKRMKISSSNVTADFTTLPIIKPFSANSRSTNFLSQFLLPQLLSRGDLRLVINPLELFIH